MATPDACVGRLEGELLGECLRQYNKVMLLNKKDLLFQEEMYLLIT